MINYTDPVVRYLGRTTCNLHDFVDESILSYFVKKTLRERSFESGSCITSEAVKKNHLSAEKRKNPKKRKKREFSCDYFLNSKSRYNGNPWSLAVIGNHL